jgi:hypothetical protein
VLLERQGQAQRQRACAGVTAMARIGLRPTILISALSRRFSRRSGARSYRNFISADVRFGSVAEIIVTHRVGPLSAISGPTCDRRLAEASIESPSAEVAPWGKVGEAGFAVFSPDSLRRAHC